MAGPGSNGPTRTNASLTDLAQVRRLSGPGAEGWSGGLVRGPGPTRSGQLRDGTRAQPGSRAGGTDKPTGAGDPAVGG